MYEWPQAPHGVDEGCGCGRDPLARILSLFFGCDQEGNRPRGRCRRPSTECLCKARGSRARVGRSHDVRHNSDTMKRVTGGRRTAMQRAKHVRRFDTACATHASEPPSRTMP